MSDRECVVYMFRNTETNETYVGSTADAKRRRRDHLQSLERGDHPNYKFQRSYNKNPNFEYSVSKPLGDRAAALAHEQQAITLLSGTPLMLNIAESATAAMWNRNHTPEARAKIAASKLGVPRPQWVKDAVGAANTGRIPSQETRDKMSLARKGMVMPPRTQEHTDKIREAKAGFTHTSESIAKIRAAAPTARKVSIDGVVYPSVAEAERNVGLSHRAIRGRIASEKEQNKDWTYL